MKCPLLNKECIEEKCAWWARFDMRDVASQKIDVQYSCVITRIPMILIEVVKNTNGTAAAVESSRNETIKRQDTLNGLFAGMAQMALDRAQLQEAGSEKLLADSARK